MTVLNTAFLIYKKITPNYTNTAVKLMLSLIFCLKFKLSSSLLQCTDYFVLIVEQQNKTKQKTKTNKTKQKTKTNNMKTGIILKRILEIGTCHKIS